MFEYKGQQYSLQQLQDFASENNVDFDQYMANMRELGMTEAEKPKSVKSIDPSATGAFFNVLQQTNPVFATALSTLSGFAAGVLLIQCSMPSAILTYLIASMYSPKEIVDNIASMIVVSTLMSLVTVPIIVFIALKYFS